MVGGGGFCSGRQSTIVFVDISIHDFELYNEGLQKGFYNVHVISRRTFPWELNVSQIISIALITERILVKSLLKISSKFMGWWLFIISLNFLQSMISTTISTIYDFYNFLQSMISFYNLWKGPKRACKS